MTATFPVTLDVFTSIPASTTQDVAIGGRTHRVFHVDEGDALEALEAKIGTGASTPAANTVLRGTGVGVTAFGQLQTGDMAANAVTQAAISTSFTGTRTAASYADVDSTNGKVTLTTTGGDLIALWFGEASNTNAGVVQQVALRLDSAAEVAVRSVYSYAGLATYPVPFCIGFFFTGVSAAAHSVFARHINSSAAGTMTTSGQLFVWERKR